MLSHDEKIGGELYLKHLKELQEMEAEKEKAVSRAEMMGEDHESIRRAHDILIEGRKKLQEQERQDLGKEKASLERENEPRELPEEEQEKDPKEQDKEKPGREAEQMKQKEMTEVEKRAEAERKLREIKERQKERERGRDGR